jgi:hypothetical protein
MTLKTVTVDGKTFAEVQDGKPVYIDGDKEIAFDAPGTVATISRLNGEAKTHREGKEAAETKLKVFEGLDAAAARDAIDKLSKIDAKKLVEAGDMDSAIQAAIKPYADKLATSEKTIGDLTGSLSKAVIGNAFGQSKYAAEKLTPAGVDLVRTMFGDRLKVEDGKVVGYDANGQKLYSEARPGELANFDEAVESMVNAYPFKDHILKGGNQSGGGSKPGNGGKGGAKTISREAFEALNPMERSGKMRDGFTITESAA